MKSLADTTNASLRWSIYVLLIAASTGVMFARVMSVTAKHGRTPFQSANDRSRWATMRALVDYGTYEIDDVIYETRNGQIRRDADGIPVRNRDWHTIDMVRHTNRDGVMRSYSSKPTLLPTLLAGVYWVVQQATGGTRVEDDPFYIGRIVLVLVNVLPLVGYFWLMALLIERYGTGDWSRIFAMTIVTFGTFITTFAVTINNHLPATVAATIAVYAALRICLENDNRWYWFALAGFMGAFTAANELPALSFFLLLGAVLLVAKSGEDAARRRTRSGDRRCRRVRDERHRPRQLEAAVRASQRRTASSDRQRRHRRRTRREANSSRAARNARGRSPENHSVAEGQNCRRKTGRALDV